MLQNDRGRKTAELGLHNFFVCMQSNFEWQPTSFWTSSSRHPMDIICSLLIIQSWLWMHTRQWMNSSMTLVYNFYFELNVSIVTLKRQRCSSHGCLGTMFLKLDHILVCSTLISLSDLSANHSITEIDFFMNSGFKIIWIWDIMNVIWTLLHQESS